MGGQESTWGMEDEARQAGDMTPVGLELALFCARCLMVVWMSDRSGGDGEGEGERGGGRG